MLTFKPYRAVFIASERERDQYVSRVRATRRTGTSNQKLQSLTKVYYSEGHEVGNGEDRKL
jgi:hypothetical protein